VAKNLYIKDTARVVASYTIGYPLYFLPNWFGGAWVLTMVVAGIAAITGAGQPFTGILVGGAILYGVLALLTLAVMVPCMYRHCCIGMDSFRNHILRHRDHHSTTLMVSLLWPYGWWWMSRVTMGMFMMDWLSWIIESFETIRETRKNGVPVEVLYPNDPLKPQRDAAPLN
jgi:hypothetical protein